MIGNEDNKITYRVQFRTRQAALAGDVIRQEARIVLSPGYTDWSDIPKIIATAHGISRDDVIIINADLIGLVIDGVQR